MNEENLEILGVQETRMDGNLARLSKEDKRELYRIMCLARALDEKISWIIKEEGRGFIPTVALLSLGEEAVTAGASYALDPAIDWIFPGHRCKAALVRFGLTPLEDLANHGCKKESLMGGRDGNVHHALIDRHVGKFVSHMGAGAAAACGVAEGLRYLYDLEGKKDDPLPVSMVFFGDGAAQQGVIHEAMNYAAVRNLPVIFVIDNNHVATVTPAREQYAAEHLFLRAIGYGMAWEYVKNGNDVVAVYNAAHTLVERARRVARFGPGTGEKSAAAILECGTYRLGAHNENFKTPERDITEFAEWRARDPLAIYRQFLLSLPDQSALEKILDREPRKMRLCDAREFREEELVIIEHAVAREVDAAYEEAKKMTDPDPISDGGLGPVWAGDVFVKQDRIVEPFDAGFRTSFSAESLKTKATLGQALQNVIRETLANNPKARVLGEDVAGLKRLRGGVFGMTLPSLKDEHIREEQIYDTPLSEAAIIGSAIGQSFVGIIPIAEMQYMPFLSVAVSQVLDYAATHYFTARVWVRMILRLPYGAGNASGHFHSSSVLEALLYHMPGIKVVDPATPRDMAGLFRQAVKEKTPVMFKENIWALNRIFGSPAADDFVLPIGLPALRKTGSDLTIITWGAKTIFDAVLPAVDELEAGGSSIEIIELRSLKPYDLGFLADSVKNTHRALIVHEDVLTGGIGESVAAKIGKECHFELVAPVSVVAGRDTPVPQHPALEAYFLPSKEAVVREARQLLSYR